MSDLELWILLERCLSETSKVLDLSDFRYFLVNLGQFQFSFIGKSRENEADQSWGKIRRQV